jgi:hypothetical protein
VNDDGIEMRLRWHVPVDRDEYRFGATARMRWTADGRGRLRYETWRDRWRSALAELFWPSRSFVVTAIDQERGTITLGDP